MVMVGYDHQDEEAVIYVAYFKIICAMGVERRDKGGGGGQEGVWSQITEI